MNMRGLLSSSLEYNYAVSERLMRRVNDAELNWKPATGKNWMTTGQLLFHITESCGLCYKGIVTGEWNLQEGGTEETRVEDTMPTAEKMRTVSSVQEALDLLAADKKVAVEMLATASDEDLENKLISVPWDTTAMPLGVRLMQMNQHLTQHKGQLYYYLKLQGQDVGTEDLW